jgi:hypothetical protein
MGTMSESLEKYAEGRLIVPAGHFGETSDANLLGTIENFLPEEDLTTVYDYAVLANTDYAAGPKGNLKDRVHESDKFEETNPELFALLRDTYFAQFVGFLETTHKLKLTDAFKCPDLHKGEPYTSAHCGCEGKVNPFITIWNPTNYQAEHTDNAEFGAVVYLNDDYEGGEINFPTLNLSIKPTKGSLLYWPGYLPHSVSPVTSGTRYTLPIFLKAISQLD